MEFERSIYRMHEQLFRSPNCVRITPCLVFTAYVLSIFLFIHWSTHHLFFVNKSEMLKMTLEQ